MISPVNGRERAPYDIGDGRKYDTVRFQQATSGKRTIWAADIKSHSVVWRFDEVSRKCLGGHRQFSGMLPVSHQPIGFL